MNNDFVLPSELLKAISNMAGTFDPAGDYLQGSYCCKDGQLYRFISDHSGAWNSSHVKAVTVGADLKWLTDRITVLEESINNAN